MSDILPPFHGPRLKLAWGRRHVNIVEQLLARFVELKPFGLVRVDPPGRSGGFNIRLTKPIPPDIPLALGDAIHNLRTSLDHLACDLVRLNGRSARSVYFPFARNGDDIEKLIKDKNFHRASDAAQALLKEIGPHPAGNRLLHALHELDVFDKHRLLVPVVHTPVVGLVHIATPAGGSQTLMECVFHGNAIDIPCPPGSVVHIEQVRPESKLSRSSELPEIVRGKPLFSTLVSLAENAESTIEAFARLYGGGDVEKPGGPPSCDNT